MIYININNYSYNIYICLIIINKSIEYILILGLKDYFISGLLQVFGLAIALNELRERERENAHFLPFKLASLLVVHSVSLFACLLARSLPRYRIYAIQSQRRTGRQTDGQTNKPT